MFLKSHLPSQWLSTQVRFRVAHSSVFPHALPWDPSYVPNEFTVGSSKRLLVPRYTVPSSHVPTVIPLCFPLCISIRTPVFSSTGYSVDSQSRLLWVGPGVCSPFTLCVFHAFPYVILHFCVLSCFPRAFPFVKYFKELGFPQGFPVGFQVYCAPLHSLHSSMNLLVSYAMHFYFRYGMHFLRSFPTCIFPVFPCFFPRTFPRTFSVHSKREFPCDPQSCFRHSFLA